MLHIVPGMEVLQFVLSARYGLTFRIHYIYEIPNLSSLAVLQKTISSRSIRPVKRSNALKNRRTAALLELERSIEDAKSFPINYNRYYTDTIHKQRLETLCTLISSVGAFLKRVDLVVKIRRTKVPKDLGENIVKSLKA